MKDSFLLTDCAQTVRLDALTFQLSLRIFYKRMLNLLLMKHTTFRQVLSALQAHLQGRSENPWNQQFDDLKMRFMVAFWLQLILSASSCLFNLLDFFALRELSAGSVTDLKWFNSSWLEFYV